MRTVRWGPRTLDVDIIACGEEVSADPELTLPHPRAHERAFVLAPWLEVDAGASLPGYGPVARLPGGCRAGRAFAGSRTVAHRCQRCASQEAAARVHMTRPGTLAGIFASCALLAWLAVRATFENLPLLPITAVPALAALALAEAAVAGTSAAG